MISVGKEQDELDSCLFAVKMDVVKNFIHVDSDKLALFKYFAEIEG